MATGQRAAEARDEAAHSAPLGGQQHGDEVGRGFDIYRGPADDADQPAEPRRCRLPGQQGAAIWVSIGSQRVDAPMPVTMIRSVSFMPEPSAPPNSSQRFNISRDADFVHFASLAMKQITHVHSPRCRRPEWPTRRDSIYAAMRHSRAADLLSQSISRRHTILGAECAGGGGPAECQPLASHAALSRFMPAAIFASRSWLPLGARHYAEGQSAVVELNMGGRRAARCVFADGLLLR